MKYLMSDYSDLTKLKIGGVPCYIVTPHKTDGENKTLIFYHGWASNAYNQIFRANIFASYGYQVVIPQAIYHGDRGRLDYDDDMTVRTYLPRVLMKNIEEFPRIHRYVVNNLGTKPENIGIAGHSMGAFTAGGIFTFKKDLKVALLYNSVLNWEWIVRDSTKGEEEISYERERVNEFLLRLNPALHMENLYNRPIVLCNGMEDQIVDHESMENFYNDLVDGYDEDKKDLAYFRIYEATGHQVTTFMINDSLEFMQEKLDF